MGGTDFQFLLLHVTPIKGLFTWRVRKILALGRSYKTLEILGLCQVNAWPPPFLFFLTLVFDLPSEGSLHLSARKILKQGPKQLFTWKLNTENIYCFTITFDTILIIFNINSHFENSLFILCKYKACLCQHADSHCTVTIKRLSIILSKLYIRYS